MDKIHKLIEGIKQHEIEQTILMNNIIEKLLEYHNNEEIMTITTSCEIYNSAIEHMNNAEKVFAYENEVPDCLVQLKENIAKFRNTFDFDEEYKTKLSNIIYNEKKNKDTTVICELPFKVGTYLKRKNGLKDHIDLLKEYVIRQDGVYAVLLLDALRDYAKESSLIPISEFGGIWILANEKEIEHEKGIQRILMR